MRQRFLFTAIFLCFIIKTLSISAIDDDRILFDLRAFDIVKQGEAEEEHMPRSEFVTIVLRMLEIQDFIDQPTVEFSDVSGDEWYAPYLYTGVSLGLLNGYDDGTFRPNEFINREQIAKILTSVLGYSHVAQTNGGYPHGYITTGANIGLFRGINMGDIPTRSQVYVAVYNALDIDMMTMSLGTDTQYKVERGNTFRNRYTDQNRQTPLHKGIGIITSNYYYYLNQPVSNIKIDQVQIEDRLFYIGQTDANKYLGQEVEFYLHQQENGALLLKNIRPTTNNHVIDITQEQFISFENSTLRYNQNQREQKLNVSTNVQYILNGQPKFNYTDADISITDGQLRLIDNNGDQLIDIIIREEYTHVRVKEVNQNRVVFAEDQTILGTGQIIFDENDNSRKILLLDANGENLNFSQLQENDILSIMTEGNGEFYKIITNRLAISGVVEQKISDRQEKVVIDNHEYIVSPTIKRNMGLGDTITAYLNHNGHIADFTVTHSGNKYAYILKYAYQGFTPYAKLLFPGTLAVEYDINDTDPDNIIKTPYIKGRNSEVRSLKVTEALAKKGLPLNMPIKYELNQNGELSRAEILEGVGMDGKRVYNGYDRTFGARAIGAFGTDDETGIICIPDSEVNNDQDYYAMVDINHKSEYMINGYQIDNNTGIAKLVVVQMTMKSDSTTEINNNSKMAVVAENKLVMNEDNEETIRLSFYSENVKKSYTIADTAIDQSRKLGFGDVFYYTLNPLNQIGKIKVIGSFAKRPNSYQYGDYNDPMDASKNGKLMFGKISDVTFKQLVDVDNKYVDKTTIFFDNNGTERYTIETDFRNPPPIYTVDMRSNTVANGSREDLIPVSQGKSEYIFVHITSGVIRGIVLFRY